ncbi:MAG TPA: hypothetical protein VFY14_08480 [Streptomyces sp.]|nr:hypothetical protein [Streptomyces sp.]
MNTPTRTPAPLRREPGTAVTRKRALHRAGDWVTILHGEDQGRTLRITAVRRFAADPGYTLTNSEFYAPGSVVLARERTGGNPCGRPCHPGQHRDFASCSHCRGTCFCPSPTTTAEETDR